MGVVDDRSNGDTTSVRVVFATACAWLYTNRDQRGQTSTNPDTNAAPNFTITEDLKHKRMSMPVLRRRNREPFPRFLDGESVHGERIAAATPSDW
jgi:hypothetical protein